ncbi:outer membrane beta-barrel protein [Galbibacter sp. EGI 63066]|uniref:outer membrane beta-barrel protein n=1 Tax=Galbibacter sp. EGI 63066 TaxID=2993559 RepID=UPI002248E993|nr:outer membrane beta-barrel protein [Galbibacter sp. EGI 63066]MCX2681208.1 outer membrane beta-barrel protein [Galbibacter sp. EGI 63066]
MKEKKNIERLFQEKFKDFEYNPPERVWTSIEASLDNKKTKRNVIPLWWKLGGIAAAIAILFLAGNVFFNNDDQPFPESNSVTDTENEIKESNSTEKNDVVDPLDTDNPQNEIVNTETDTSSEEDIKNTSVETDQQTIQKDAEDEWVNSDQQRKTTNEPTVTQENIDKNLTNDEIDATDKGRGEIAQVETTETNKETPVDKQEETEIVTQQPVSPEKEKTEVAQNDANQQNQEEKDTLTEKKSLLEAVAEMENEEETDPVVDTQNSRWAVNPNIAPVYYNTLSNGSPISQEFANNSKEGGFNMSVGINIAYNISKRLSIRSGVSNVKVGYTTDNIEFSPSVIASNGALANITFNRPEPTVNVADQKSAALNSEVLSRPESITETGSMNQKFGYLEVPMELKYRLIDNKFGVNIIGGVSSLFLTANEVSLKTNNLETEVGHANNVNDLSFSTNIGIGLDYQVSDKVLFNLEPMFKYQLNTFSREDGGFSPYILGVYTGLSFKF